METHQKLFLIFHGRFPSEKAASLFAAKSCESFAKEGATVTLLVPRRLGRGIANPYEYYKIDKNFSIVYLPILDLFGIRHLERFAFHVGFITFSFSCFFYLFFSASRKDLIYSNESLPIVLSSLYFPRTFYEVHDFPERKMSFYQLLFRRVKYILVTNVWKTAKLADVFGVVKEKMLCERNAVEVADFDILETKEDARKKLKLPLEGNIVIYTGHLYSWKGVDMLALAAPMLPPDTTVIFVGGTKNDVERFTLLYGKTDNIRIIGHRNHSEMPLWQKAADVLVLPNTAKEDISKYYTSPMKLFEYMASHRPVVASDIPSVKEILNNTNALLVPPDNPNALAQGIVTLLQDVQLSERIAGEAYKDVLFHTWQARAQRILKFVGITEII